MNPDNLAARLDAEFPRQITRLPAFRGETAFAVADRGRIGDVARFLKRECSYDYLVDISSVDNAGDSPRFEVVYEFYSHNSGRHVRVKAAVPEEACSLPSIAGVYKTANWHEREIFDMMGIRFDGHPDLRRILMWEGYPHFPLRKEFPLEGLPTLAPDGHFTNPAPMAGGPFVAPAAELAGGREPRSAAPEPA